MKKKSDTNHEVIKVKEIAKREKNVELSLSEKTTQVLVETAVELALPLIAKYLEQKFTNSAKSINRLDETQNNIWDKKIMLNVDYIEREQKKENPNWEVIKELKKELYDIENSIKQEKKQKIENERNMLSRLFYSIKSLTKK